MRLPDGTLAKPEHINAVFCDELVKQELEKITTETGAGQWGTALSEAAAESSLKGAIRIRRLTSRTSPPPSRQSKPERSRQRQFDTIQTP